MELNIGLTSIISIFVMPESDDDSTQSPFQGFLGEILSQDYITNLTKFSIYPQDVHEIFMSPDELIYFRNYYTKPNHFLLRPTAIIKHIPLIEGHPFVVLTCLPDDLEFVESIKHLFTFAPIIVSPTPKADVNTEDKFDCFIFDLLFYERLQSYADKHTEEEVLGNLLKEKALRSKELIDLNFISRNHGVTHATEAVIYGLGYTFNDAKNIQGSPDKTEYVNAIIESANNLIGITGQDKDICKSDLIIYSPSIYSHLYKFNSNWWNQSLRPIKDKRVKDFIKNGVFKNPSYSGIAMDANNPFNPYDFPVAREILMTRQLEIALTVLAVKFIAISNNAPAIRLPNGVNFHSGEIRELEKLSMLPGRKRQINFKKKFKTIVTNIKDNIGDDLIEFIKNTSNSLTLCTDIPLEWVSVDKIPLMFTHQISKIHTTPGNMLLLNASQPVNITIHKKELFNVTVIRSFNDNDPIKEVLEKSLTHFAKIDGVVNISIVDVKSEEELICALNSCDSHILIFDCHGNHGGSESNGWLQIGEDKVDTWSLTYKAQIPLIVILSACLTSAVSGSHASVANGLIKSGALSVLGTFLPVDAIKSAAFMGRIIYRLSGFLNAVEKLGVEHLTWREFNSGFFRMSYCTDILQEFRDTYKIINQDQYIEIHKFGNGVINSYQSSWFEKVINAVSIESNQEEDKLFKLVDEIGITESMYYMQLGRPENIRIIFKD